MRFVILDHMLRTESTDRNLFPMQQREKTNKDGLIFHVQLEECASHQQDIFRFATCQKMIVVLMNPFLKDIKHMCFETTTRKYLFIRISSLRSFYYWHFFSFF